MDAKKSPMDMLKMAKQAMDMQKEMKKIQKQLASKTVEFSGNGGQIKITMSCDMKVQKIVLAPEFVQSGNMKKIESSLVDAINGSIVLAQSEAAKDMKSLTAGLGLPF